VILTLGLAGMALAVLCLRLGWRRRRGVVALGWALGIAAAARLTARWGMWGLCTAILGGIAAAAVVLAYEALVSPAVFRPVRARITVTTPRWRVEGLARRLATFLLVVPIGFAATEMLALGAETAASRAGWVEANSTVLALVTQPLAWAALASMQMITRHPRSMIAPAALCALAGAILWL